MTHNEADLDLYVEGLDQQQVTHDNDGLDLDARSPEQRRVTHDDAEPDLDARILELHSVARDYGDLSLDARSLEQRQVMHDDDNADVALDARSLKHQSVAHNYVNLDINIASLDRAAGAVQDGSPAEINLGEAAKDNGKVREVSAIRLAKLIEVGLRVHSGFLNGIRSLLVRASTDELWIIILGVSIIVIFVKYIVFSDVSAKEHVEAVALKTQDLNASCESVVVDMERRLVSMSELSACLAERNFDGQRRSFQKFLQRTETQSGWSSHMDLLPPFRLFVRRWLGVFEECSINPLDRPKRLVTDKELRHCRDVAQISRLVSDRLELHQVVFISQKMKKFQDSLHDQRQKLRPLSSSRSLMSSSLSCGKLIFWIIFVSAVLVTIQEWVSGKLWLFYVMCAADMCLACVIAKYDSINEVARLEWQMQQLEKDVAQVRKRRDKLTAFHQQMQLLANLWLFRTVPCLDLLTELHELIQQSPPEDALQVLTGAVSVMEHVDRGLGPLRLWYGKDALHESKLKAMGKRLASCADVVKEADQMPYPMQRISRHVCSVFRANESNRASRFDA